MANNDIVGDKRFLNIRLDVPERRERINYVARMTGAQSPGSAIDDALAFFMHVSRRLPALLTQVPEE